MRAFLAVMLALVAGQSVAQGLPTPSVSVYPQSAIVLAGYSSVYAVVVVGPDGRLAGGGVVDFFADGAAACVGRPVVRGVATCQITVAPRGIHQFAAHYGGDSTFLPADSAVREVDVLGATTMDIDIRGGSYVGNKLTFVSRTSPQIGGAATFLRGDGVPLPDCNAVPMVPVDGGFQEATCDIVAPPGMELIVSWTGLPPGFAAQSVKHYIFTFRPAPRQRVDFNGDGKADLLWSHADGRAATWMVDGPTPIDSFALIGAGTGWRLSNVGDFNGDGKTDLLWTHADGSAALWLVDGHLQVGGVRLVGPGTGWSPFATGDINGDRKDDIVWTHLDGSVAIWLMDGTRQVGGMRVQGPGTGFVLKAVTDVNNDGRSDLVLQHADGTAKVLFMDGNGGFIASQVQDPGSGATFMVAGGMANDRVILFRAADGSVQRCRWTGSWERTGISGLGTVDVLFIADTFGTLTNGYVYRDVDGSVRALGIADPILPAGSSSTVVRMADLNADGIADAIILAPDGSVGIRMGVSTGILTPPRHAPLVGILAPGTGWMPFAAEDRWPAP